MADCNFFCKLSHDAFVEEIVDLYCVTNLLHPFRESNSRAQRAFLIQLIRAAGYDTNGSEIDTDLLMFATIQSANGLIDLQKKCIVRSYKVSLGYECFFGAVVLFVPAILPITVLAFAKLSAFDCLWLMQKHTTN